MEDITNDLFYHKCGGINTFDAAFAAKVGGYPKGAVLQYLNGNYIYDVISLIDNNMFDFVASNTIDGANWAYCNKETSSSDRILVVESSTTVNANNSQGLLLGVFKAPKNGFIVFEGNYTVNTQVGVSADGTNAGFAVALYDLGASYTTIPTLTAETLKNWKTIYTVPIEKDSDFNFVKVYPFSPNYSDNEYMLISQINGIENSYVITECKTEFDGLFIADKDNIYGTIFNITPTDITRNVNNTKLEMLNDKYPTVFTNSEANYISGNTSGCFLKVNADTCQVDVEGGMKYRKELLDWLTNNKTKIL